MTIHIIFFIVSISLTAFFFLYGFNQYFLLRAARVYRAPVYSTNQNRPTVSVHLPIYNEKYVICRLITACTSMAEVYGRELVSILVLDDSTDATTAEVDRVVKGFVESGYRISVLRREGRQGYKAGALQEALTQTNEEYIAIFDADYVPPPDFLTQTIPYFAKDERLGIVQSRWSYLNRDFNALTKAIAIWIDIHFLIEQPGRYSAGCLQNFNGSGGVLRKKAILEAGGWQSDTLTEDLDLSYRMQLKGFRVLYLKDVQIPGEIPPTVPSFKKQQGRWACGSLQTAKKILPGLLTKSKLGLISSTEAFIHLTSYSIHVMMVIAFLTACLSTFFHINEGIDFNLFSGRIPALLAMTSFQQTQNIIWSYLFPLILLCTIAPWVSAITTLKKQKIPVWPNLTSLLVLFLVGFGISLSNTREAYKALFLKKSWEFVRTPKYADLRESADWQSKTYQVPLDPMWVLELAFVCLGITAIAVGFWQANYTILLILVPFTAAYAYVLLMTLRESRPERLI